VAPELEKERDARVAGALHTLTLLAGMPDIMLPTQRLQLLTMVCTHGAKFDRLQSQARLSALFSSLATFYDSYTHPRVSDADLGAAIDQCLAVAQAADAHWRYRMLASVVLMMYALPRVGAIAAEQSARVVAHFASSAVGPLRQLRVIGRLATAWLLLHFKRHLTTGAELVSPSDDEVRAYAARVPTDTSDDSDESALYFDGAPWVGRALDGDALACGVRARPRCVCRRDAAAGWSARARVALHRRAVSGQAVRACGRRSRGNRRRLDERHDWLGRIAGGRAC
jgi:hypothetical protein